MTTYTKQQLREWKHDPLKAAHDLGKVVDRKSKLSRFVPNANQLKLHAFLEENREAYILKSRQLGSTTYILWRFFIRALLTPQYRVAIIAHTASAVTEIFLTVHRFYDNLPEDLKALIPTTKANTQEMLFPHGSALRVCTASSDSFRGTTYNAVLFSEFAFYQDPSRTIAAVLQTSTGDAEIVLETTANGLNYAHGLWGNPEVGYAKLFLHWRDEPAFTRPKSPGYQDPQMEVFAQHHKLTPGQKNWAAHYLATRCAGDWKIFNQEQPLTADIAFVSTGGRVFMKQYPGAREEPGYRIYGDYNNPTTRAVRQFSLGADVATGYKAGDFSAFVVLDITVTRAPVVAAVFYKRVDTETFTAEILQAARYFNDAFVTVEINGPGPAVVEGITQHGYHNVYVRQSLLKTGGDQTQKLLGFLTTGTTRPVLISRLRVNIDNDRVRIPDTNLQHEINTFIYDEKGREDHDKGCHDDALFALGLALMGMDQCAHAEHTVMTRRPQGIEQILAWEAATGQDYQETAHEFDSDYSTPDNYAQGIADVY